MRRREFIKLLSSTAAAWPLTAQAQHAGLPLIGFLEERSPDVMGVRLRAFHQGLKETGFVDGDNVSILYRFAENQADRLVGLAADLVQRNATVIVAPGPSAAFAVKAATTTIPTLFIVAEDPVSLGLVASLARPGGNLTGINIFNGELTAKRLALLRELVPRVARVAVLVNPADVGITKSTLQIVEGAARDMGLQIAVLNANNVSEINAVFENIESSGADALFVGASIFLNGRRVQLVQLAPFLSVRRAKDRWSVERPSDLASELTDHAFRKYALEICPSARERKRLHTRGPICERTFHGKTRDG